MDFNEIALAGRIVQFILLFAFISLTAKEYIMGDRGKLSVGLLVAAIGLLVACCLGLFAALTIHPTSPRGYLFLLIPNSQYNAIIDTTNAIASWITNIGIIIIAWGITDAHTGTT